MTTNCPVSFKSVVSDGFPLIISVTVLSGSPRPATTTSPVGSTRTVSKLGGVIVFS